MKQINFSIHLFRSDQLLKRLLYPVAGGLVLAYLTSSVTALVLYRQQIIPPEVKLTVKTEVGKKLPQSIDIIMKKNIFGLKAEEEPEKTITTGKTTNGIKGGIAGYKLLGTIAGKEAVAILKKDNKIFLLKRGDEFNGYKVAAISLDGIVVKGKSGNIHIRFPEKIKNVSYSSREKESPVPGDQKKSLSNKIVLKKEEILSRSQDLNQLLTTVRISPYFRGDKFIGYKITMLKRSSFLYNLGLRAGDILKSINGEGINSPTKAVEILSKIDQLTSLNIDLLRRGEKKTIFIEIEE